MSTRPFSIFGLASIIVIITGCSAAPTTAFIPDIEANYAGEWEVKWQANNSRNPVALIQDERKITGIYTNSNGVSCPVDGLYNSDLYVTLRIDCPGWTLHMQGLGNKDGNLIKGRYEGGGNQGEFVMLKQ